MKLPEGIQLIRFLLFSIAVAAGAACGYFGQEAYAHYAQSRNSGLDGGAIGTGVISGCSLIGLAITYIGSTKK